MNHKFLLNDWKIVEEGFDPQMNRFSESIFSLGNEHMGLRGFFEEGYSGDGLTGTYVAGVYYPDKTRVGWWKNGYPEYFAKVANSTDWIRINVTVDGVSLDLAHCKVIDFRRELDMKEGKLLRSFIWLGDDGRQTEIRFMRFLSRADPNVAFVSLTLTPQNYSGEVAFTPLLDGNVINEDANYGEVFWDEIERTVNTEYAFLMMETKKSGFWLATAMQSKIFIEGKEISTGKSLISNTKKVGIKYSSFLRKGERLELQKLVVVCTSRDYLQEELRGKTLQKLQSGVAAGSAKLWDDHRRAMADQWKDYDVVIKGDLRVQQGIRYAIFQLNQTYTGKDPRLNIGPKGFTGEKYGGTTYWDTEAFCFPFYLYNHAEVAEKLLRYRYAHLQRAKENAAKLGLKGALYPMVTVDGKECHNEWEITFEEIHRNGAIAYAIYNYTNYTGDRSYLNQYGIEVLVELSRFWVSRMNYQPRKNKYMILGVTGPNEYENNVNNNWYTNLMAAWTLEYTLDSLRRLDETDSPRYLRLFEELQLDQAELLQWQDIISKMYYPIVSEFGIFEQNDLYMDKEQMLVADLSEDDLPLNKHWSWDRILRSNFIKQADVIQGIYFLKERFDTDCIRKNFDFYEPRTVHESSLSASIHSIVASWIGYHDKAYELYLRTARLDLDNYNRDTEDGLHLTSMAGTWLAIVQGFAGVRVENGKLCLNPYLPKQWSGYSFNLTYRKRRLHIEVSKEQLQIVQVSGEPVEIIICNREHWSKVESTLVIKGNFERGCGI